MSELTEHDSQPRQTLEQFLSDAERIKDMYVHAVTFTFKEQVPEAEINEALEMLRKLGELPGIEAWMIRESVDQRKGHTALELGVFKNGQAFIDFHEHPKHQEFVEKVRHIADWVIVDFEGAERTVVDTIGDVGKLGILGFSETQKPS